MELARAKTWRFPVSQAVFTPVLGGLMQHAGIARAITGAAAMQCGAQMLGVTLWQCPLHHFTGVPCPGCGLTRGCVCCLRGSVGQGMEAHAFAPVFIVAMGLLAFTAVAPAAWRSRAALLVSGFERKTGITGGLLLLFVAYWLARLLLLGPGYWNSV